MSNKAENPWKPQEPAPDFTENVMARILADPPPHIRMAMARERARSLARRTRTTALVIALGVLLAAMLAIAGALRWGSGEESGVAPSIARPAPSVEADGTAPVGALRDPSDEGPEREPTNSKSSPSTRADGSPLATTPPSSRKPPAEGGGAVGILPRPIPRLFDGKAARAVLEKEFQKAKEKCNVPPDGYGTIVTFKATFSPEGSGSGTGKLEGGEHHDEAAAVRIRTQRACVSDEMERSILIIPPFDGPSETFVHHLKF